MRTNDEIRANEVRLVLPDGNQAGIVPIDEARQQAKETGLDLVEVAPEADPPVCRIYDYKKALYEKRKKAKESKKKSRGGDLKEVKMRVTIDPHDRDFKLRHARKFLEKGDKVKFTIQYRGRENTKPQLGERLIEAILEDLKDIAEVENRPNKIGSQQVMIVTRRKDFKQRQESASE